MSTPDWLKRAQDAWSNRGQARPDFAEATAPGEESVWDYPRPPRLEQDHREVRVMLGDIEIARSARAMRLLETADHGQRAGLLSRGRRIDVRMER